MKIVHLTYTLDYGGIETMLVNIANIQCNQEHVSIVILNNKFESSILEKLDKRVTFINVGRKIGSKSIFPIIKLNIILARLNADIIHIHHPGLIRILLKSCFKSKIVFTMHDIPQPQDLPFIPQFKTIYAISNSVKQSLEKYGFKSTVVYNGIVFDEFKKKSSKNEHLRILQVGRLIHNKKGQDLMIEACNKLKERQIKNYTFDIIGDGPSLDFLKEKIHDYGLRDNINLLGSKEQTYIKNHLCDYDLFVQPSRVEGFGLTVVEAIAAKVPTLVSDQEGPMEITDNGKYAYTFKTGEVYDLVRVLENIICGKLNLNTDAAYEYAFDKFDVQITANEYLSKYRLFLGE